jgi:hypothetical protein
MNMALYLDIGRIVVPISIALATAVLAYRRGFNPLIWLFAGSNIGLLILVFLPSAKEHGVGLEISKECRLAGNVTGGVLAVVQPALIYMVQIGLAL